MVVPLVPVLLEVLLFAALIWLLFIRSGKPHVIPYFPPNEAQLKYYQLSSSTENESELKPALIQRAIEAIRRSHIINEEKPSLTNLNQAGALSEDFLTSLLEAEKETAAELFDIQCEAELIKEGWSRSILQESAALIKHAIVTNNPRKKQQ